MGFFECNFCIGIELFCCGRHACVTVKLPLSYDLSECLQPFGSFRSTQIHTFAIRHSYENICSWMVFIDIQCSFLYYKPLIRLSL